MLFKRVTPAVLLLFMFSASAQASTTVTPVKSTSAYESAPVADTYNGHSYLGWTQNTPAHPRYWRVYLSTDHGAPKQVNPSGTEAFYGDLDQQWLTFQQWPAGGKNANVVVRDIDQGSTVPVAAVNNRYWQWGPSTDGTWLLYGENRFAKPTSPWKVILYNLHTHRKITLADSTRKCRCLYPGQVRGQFVVWSKAGSVYVYNIVTRRTARVPRPSKRFDYAPALDDPDPAVDGDESVYFMRAGAACGSSVHLIHVPAMSARVMGAQTVAYSLAKNRDISAGPYIDDTGGQRDIYLSSYNCRTKDSNILKLDGTP